MYSLMVVDDEQIVLRAVSHIVSQHCPDVKVIAQVRSGTEAITKALEKKPDIVFMDIELSGLDGLEAIQEIKKALPEAVFVIISAYDEFTYARRSIELGVMDYLLKPISKDDVVRILKQAVRTIEKQRQRKEAELRLREKVRRMLPLIEEDFFFSLLYPASVARSMDEYQKLLEWDYRFGQAAMVYAVDKTWNPDRQTQYRQLIRRILGREGGCLVSPAIGRTVLVLRGTNDEEVGTEKWKQLYQRFEQEVGHQISLILGPIYSGFEGLTRSYKELRQVTHTTQYEPGLFQAAELVPSRPAERFQIPWQQEQNLFAAVKNGNVETAAVELKRLFDFVDRQGRLDLQGQKDYFHEIIAVLARLVYEFIPEEEFRTTDFTVYRKRVENATELDSLHVTLAEIITSMARTIRAVKTEDHHPVIEKATAFIDSNFHRNINLSDIAAAAAVSPSYLSKLFKESFSVTVVDYLTDIRIERALRLLKTTSLPIQEISRRVGYSDPNYFSKVFKKVTGLTPSSVRNQKKKRRDENAGLEKSAPG